MLNIDTLKDGYSPLKLKATQVQRKIDEELTQRAHSPLAKKTIRILAPLLLIPKVALAADAFGNIHTTAMAMFDGGVVLIIIFAGASWALGHRGKAIEYLIGASCGYILARHAVDIRDWLRTI